jgi:hypothetical protein
MTTSAAQVAVARPCRLRGVPTPKSARRITPRLYAVA